MSRPTTVINVRGCKPADLLADPRFVYVGRALPRRGWKASPWGNPFPVDRAVTVDGVEYPPAPAEVCVERYREWFARQPHLIDALPTLKGKRLGCWCCAWDGSGEPAQPCHAVWLARRADAT